MGCHTGKITLPVLMKQITFLVHHCQRLSASYLQMIPKLSTNDRHFQDVFLAIDPATSNCANNVYFYILMVTIGSEETAVVM